MTLTPAQKQIVRRMRKQEHIAYSGLTECYYLEGRRISRATVYAMLKAKVICRDVAFEMSYTYTLTDLGRTIEF